MPEITPAPTPTALTVSALDNGPYDGLATTAVVMVTVDHRVEFFNRFLRSLAKRYGAVGLRSAPALLIHVQGDYKRWRALATLDDYPGPIEIHRSEEMQGCHAARVNLLRWTDLSTFDTYINVDDDVVLIEQTDWVPAVEKARQEGVGFVLTNWIKHPNQLPAAIQRLSPVFQHQIMLYQGGGMAYGRDVAELMATLPAVHARYDDLWPLTAYLDGYRSYRYQGSIAIHQIMVRGGMNAYMKAEPRPLLCTEWINYRRLEGRRVGDDYSIPMDSDLKASAREQHKLARAAKGWT